MDKSNQGRVLSEIEDDKLKEAVAKGEVRLKTDPDDGKTDVGSADSYPDGEKPDIDSSSSKQSQPDSEKSQKDDKVTEVKAEDVNAASDKPDVA